MPIYKYECDACSHIFEDLRSFSEPDPEACPACGADAVRKLITGGNFMLKGSGWYVTDYSQKSAGAASEAQSQESQSQESQSKSAQVADSGQTPTASPQSSSAASSSAASSSAASSNDTSARATSKSGAPSN